MFLRLRAQAAAGRAALLGRGFASLTVRSVQYAETGAPKDVLKLVETQIERPTSSSLAPGQVFLRFLAAPINPADINMIEGVYSIKPPLPAIGGNEGVAVVEAVGPDIAPEHAVNVGSWVIPSQAAFGTWRTHAVCAAADVTPIPNEDRAVSVDDAATLSVNPCTAYRMLKDFAHGGRGVAPGDVVIQNAATSGVGTAVIQIAKAMGVKTINVIRDRPNLEETVSWLKSLGADAVITEETLLNRDAFKAALQRAGIFSGSGGGGGGGGGGATNAGPCLALNAVGGPSCTELTRVVRDQGVVVTYGGMSKKPVTVPTGRFIFNDVALRGFWLSRWVATRSRAERQQMLDAVLALVRSGQLRPAAAVQSFAIQDFKQALERAQQGFRNAKVMFRLTEEL